MQLFKQNYTSILEVKRKKIITGTFKVPNKDVLQLLLGKVAVQCKYIFQERSSQHHVSQHIFQSKLHEIPTSSNGR